MFNKDRSSQPPRPALATRLDELRKALQGVPVNVLAQRTGARYQETGPGEGEFSLPLFDDSVLVTYPGFVGVDAQREGELPLPNQAVLAYYFFTSDGASLTGEWVSFAELPDGRMYNRAFQGYSGDELVKEFGLNVDAFKAVCKKGGGVAAPYGSAAYIFHALPKLPMLVNYWCGDEDFPSSCKILFDRSVHHFLPTDVCAILGSILTRKLVKNLA